MNALLKWLGLGGYASRTTRLTDIEISVIKFSSTKGDGELSNVETDPPRRQADQFGNFRKYKPELDYVVDSEPMDSKLPM